ncbi:hypothetical protein AALP_AA1G286000 [Arabis alpina]|uniref:Uncharacterized protein n=1 Tax=Arabis alpina TaxID=50452 RepID=A0A087HR98_ARAAL|nr:hypothetical protein AALP_AA1G286000 [Arabis alpina]
MSNAKDFKETFKRYDQYLNGEISWIDVGMADTLNNSPPSPRKFSEVDNIIGELKTEGEDRVFGGSKLLVNNHRPSSSRLVMKHEDVTKVEMYYGMYRKKTENQVQVPKKALGEEKDTGLDDWVVIGNDDIINYKK